MVSVKYVYKSCKNILCPEIVASAYFLLIALKNVKAFSVMFFLPGSQVELCITVVETVTAPIFLQYSFFTFGARDK